MVDHLCTQLDEQAVRERYALLSQACESAAGKGNQQLEQQLQALEQIIERDLPALARKGSPDNITDLLQALRLEMTRFREFCEYPALPSKVVVGLGGSFSAGKSSLINALIGDRQCLVTEVDPTTSLPTYLVQGKGEQTEVHAINLFNRVVSLSHEQFRTLTHDEKSRYGSQVSSLLKSVVVAHPALPWGNLALLDTPGYSKANQAGSERTDANLARTQLNSAQFIVWLVPADKGTITEEDIAFLGTLDRAIPKLVVISRADKHLAEEIEKIVVLVRDTLAKRGVSVLNVIPFSNRPRSMYSVEPLLDYFTQWNKALRELGFAQQFKRQFMAYQSFIDKERQEAQLLLNKFNRVLTLSDDSTLLDDIDVLQKRSKYELVKIEQIKEELVDIKMSFFIQLKEIGDDVGIPLPEPDALSLLDLEPSHISQLLQEVAAQWGINATGCDSKLWELLNQSQVNNQFDIGVLGNRVEIRQQDDVTRSYYAALLLLILLKKGEISAIQQRMLELWLPAIGLADRQAEMSVLASSFGQDTLKDVVKLLKKDSKLFNGFLLDVILFIRIDQRLSSDTVTVIEMLAGFFELDELQIKRVICMAMFILGAPINNLTESKNGIDLPTYYFTLGVMFSLGIGVVQNYQQSAIWFRKAADLDHNHAQYELSVQYFHGRGMAQDKRQAIVWLREAAQGYIQAQYLLGLFYIEGTYVEKDTKQGCFWLNKAAEQGHANAQYDIAVMYHNGNGVEKNYQTAVSFLRKAAEKQHVNAQCFLGKIYYEGRKIEPENFGLFANLRRAAERGRLDHGGITGNDHKEVEQDKVQAYAWFSVAAEKGYSNSADLRDKVSDELTHAELRDAKALAVKYIGECS